ncbi:hypothetical protein [Sphingobium sp. B2]|uniref:hypothetical protein n=1 Tax=Sphingobium sp. B2 TaxID=2583228 RepID=UPI0011A2C0A1|nr:hypothetical protein [Sphingobium sp. B2]
MGLGFDEGMDSVATRRVREMEDAFGMTLTLSVEPYPGGATILIERCDTQQSIMMDAYGAEILAAMLLLARMNSPDPVPDEHLGGRFPLHIALVVDPAPHVTVLDRDGALLRLPVHLWDRLYLELTLACAHAREMARQGGSVH